MDQDDLASTASSQSDNTTASSNSLKLGRAEKHLIALAMSNDDNVPHSKKVPPANTTETMDRIGNLEKSLRATTIRNDDTLGLRDHLDKLPLELYDIIHDMTFTSAKGVVHISDTKKYPKPPLNLMQVSHATRAQYIASYYSNNIYVVRHPTQWFKTIPRSQRFHLKRIQCPVNPNIDWLPLLINLIQEHFGKQCVKYQIKEASLELIPTVRINFDDPV
jgi:hypothetical protein